MEIGPYSKIHLHPLPWRDQSKEEKKQVPIRSPLTNCWGKQEVYTEGVVILPKSPEGGLPAPPWGVFFTEFKGGMSVIKSNMAVIAVYYTKF